MPGQCPICECDDLFPAVFITRADDHTSGGRCDYLALKRDLESTFDLSLSLTTVKEHDSSHFEYERVFDPDGLGDVIVSSGDGLR